MPAGLPLSAPSASAEPSLASILASSGYTAASESGGAAQSSSSVQAKRSRHSMNVVGRRLHKRPEPGATVLCCGTSFGVQARARAKGSRRCSFPLASLLRSGSPNRAVYWAVHSPRHARGGKGAAPRRSTHIRGTPVLCSQWAVRALGRFMAVRGSFRSRRPQHPTPAAHVPAKYLNAHAVGRPP